MGIEFLSMIALANKSDYTCLLLRQKINEIDQIHVCYALEGR